MLFRSAHPVVFGDDNPFPHLTPNALRQFGNIYTPLFPQEPTPPTNATNYDVPTLYEFGDTSIQEAHNSAALLSVFAPRTPDSPIPVVVKPTNRSFQATLPAASSELSLVCYTLQKGGYSQIMTWFNKA